MKLLGLVLVTFSGLVWGIGKGRQLRAQAVLLGELQQLIQRLRTEIGYSARPLGEILAENRSRICQEAKNQPEFAYNPCLALEQAGEKLFGGGEGGALCRGLAQGLGTSGIQGQLEHLQLYSGLVEVSLREAEEACRQKGRLYLALGVLAGLTVCVIAI